VCSFGPRDYDLADVRESCVSDVEVYAEAGARIFAEHGSIAAALAADAILNDEVAPARVIRFTGGIEPSFAAVAVTASPRCRLAAPPWTHGPIAWDALDARGMRMAAIVRAASRELGARPEALAVELDAPLCLDRVCDGCGASAGAAFWIPGALACPSCSGVVRQRLHLSQRRFAVTQRRPVFERTLSELDAPVGVGMRFASNTNATWNAYAEPAPRRQEEV
jgi:hypothetical protein